ncbi:MAG: protein-glutamate O-methyltransferase CheR [Desulfuromonadales bacterium]
MKSGLSTQTFNELSHFIYDELGIKMPPGKKTMLEGRLTKRMRALGLESHDDYCRHVFSEEGQGEELVHLLDAVTTNKTDFFREPSHFDYLTATTLPELARTYGAGMRRRLRLWSAGCSTGEEPYTLAMVLSDYAETVPGFKFDIFATDISTRVLEKARRAVYEKRLIAPVSPAFRKKYLLKSKDPNSPLVRIAPAQRAQVTFGRLNFMDDDFGWPEPMDIIFCRNVIIYFDKPTQEALMNRFCRYLRPGGYLFLGHSESLHGYDVPLKQVAPTVYRFMR